MSPATRNRLVVIGAGPGGYSAAFHAAELGLEVTLVDPGEQPGGVCLHRGCIPSKALLHIAHLVSAAAEAEGLGVHFAAPNIDLERVRAWKDGVVETLTGALGTKADRLKITRVRGLARFASANSLVVTGTDGTETELAFDQAIIATGSRPALLPGIEPGGPILDATGALALERVPKSLLVVGGGYIGLELGSVYAALGSKVTVVEMTSGLLPGCDRDLVSVLKRRLDKRFEAMLTSTAVTELKVQKSGVSARLESRGKEAQQRRFDQVLVAIGRRPNSDALQLEQAGLATDAKGFIPVDGQQRTQIGHIFAIGDVCGEPMLAHKAYAEARVAAEAAAGRKAVFEPRAIPAVVFTDPEIAWCGLTETAARAEGRVFETAKLPWRGNGRTLTLGRDDGMTKLIVDKETGRLLGVGLVGPNAGELIAEAALALEMAATAEDLRATIHPHPTLSETFWDAAKTLKI
ncbi:MAG: dihydrolipoyl dehydrogenase [Geothermobacteraceae bacterium]